VQRVGIAGTLGVSSAVRTALVLAMARVGDLPYRFRPAGAPGAASAAGVPIDRRADQVVELEPIFAQLADTERRCLNIRERARRDAAAIRAREADRASGLAAATGSRTEAERAAVVASVGQRADTEADAMLAEAQPEAEALRNRANDRMPDVVAQVVAVVLGMLGEPPNVERETAAS